MALYVTRPRRDEERIGRGLPNDTTSASLEKVTIENGLWRICVFQECSRGIECILHCKYTWSWNRCPNDKMIIDCKTIDYTLE